MCGIAGWFSSTPLVAGEARHRLHGMVEAIRHRGPNGRGYQYYGHAALGHARLSIIDLAGGQQPLTLTEPPLSLIFNGEIYNYKDLREQLSRAGQSFRTHSDTEVILRLYLTEGWQGLAKLRGMYAVALWDEGRKCGFLVRDPMGIKPLFYRAGKSGELLFGSEAKAILAGGCLAELDEKNLHLLLNFRYLPGERSLFRGIRQLGAGMVMAWTLHGHRQWMLPKPETGPQTKPLDALRDSVTAHLTADVEVGVYLSGGIDSAAIAAIAEQKSSQALRSFTLAVGDDPEEANNASRTATLLGLENIRGGIGETAESSLPRLISHLELPKVNSLQVGELARLAATEVKVVLSGLGGDELFLGYNAHRIMYYAQTVARCLPRSVARRLGRLGARLAAGTITYPWSEPERAFGMLTELGHWPRVYGLMRNLWDNPTLRRKIYGPRLLDVNLPDPFGVLEDAWPAGATPLASMAQFEWEHKMRNDLLWQEDRMSMAHGLEVRVPFVDLWLKRSVEQYDTTELLPRGRQKALMRDMLRPILPREIMHRPKSGFQVDAATFFHEQLAPLASYWLSDAKIRESGLFNPWFVKQVLSLRPAKHLRWHYFMLYLMLGTQIWLHLFEGEAWQNTQSS